VLRHGPVDQIKVKEKAAAGTGPRPAKECHECHSVVAAGYAACPDCGFVFPVPERQSHEAAGVGRGRAVRSGDEHEVPRQRRVLQRPHEAQRASDGRSEVDARSTTRSAGTSSSRNGSASNTKVTRGRRPSPGGNAARPIRCPTPPNRPSAGPVRCTRHDDRDHRPRIAGEPYERITDYEVGRDAGTAAVRSSRPTDSLDDVPF
jgi:hypothetical protein